MYQFDFLSIKPLYSQSFFACPFYGIKGVGQICVPLLKRYRADRGEFGSDTNRMGLGSVSPADSRWHPCML